MDLGVRGEPGGGQFGVVDADVVPDHHQHRIREARDHLLQVLGQQPSRLPRGFGDHQLAFQTERPKQRHLLVLTRCGHAGGLIDQLPAVADVGQPRQVGFVLEDHHQPPALPPRLSLGSLHCGSQLLEHQLPFRIPFGHQSTAPPAGTQADRPAAHGLGTHRPAQSAQVLRQLRCGPAARSGAARQVAPGQQPLELPLPGRVQAGWPPGAGTIQQPGGSCHSEASTPAADALARDSQPLCHRRLAAPTQTPQQGLGTPTDPTRRTAYHPLHLHPRLCRDLRDHPAHRPASRTPPRRCSPTASSTQLRASTTATQLQGTCLGGGSSSQQARMSDRERTGGSRGTQH